MNYYHIFNLINEDGNANYKGLDISKNIVGSQVYFDNECILCNADLIEDNEDLKIITEEEYNTIKTEVNKRMEIYYKEQLELQKKLLNNKEE